MKKINIITLFVVFIMIFNSLGVLAQGVNEFEEITIFFPGEPSYVQNQSEAYFTVEIKRMGSGRNYEILYSIDNPSIEYKDEMEVGTGRYFKKTVSLSHLPKGSYVMNVKVMDGERVAAEKALGMGIIEFYEPQIFDAFSRIGITAGMTQTGGYEIRHLASNQADLLKKCGLNNIRYSGAGTWVSVEKLHGVYNFLGTNIYREYFEDMNNIQFVGGSRGIDLYKDPNGETAPRTVEQLDALLSFIREKFNHYPIENSHRNIFSVWNEPNLQNYWPILPSAYEYSVMQRAIALESKKRYPEMPVIALDIANGTDVVEYIKKMFDTDAYPYIEGYSFHPYSFPRDIDSSYEPLISKFLDLEDEYGGWLDCYITETGYPTPKSTQGVSETVQAENVIKALVYDDKHEIDGTYFYSFKNNGASETDRESNFGILHYDWSPKIAYATMAQANKMIGNANYVGETDLGEGINAYVYNGNGKTFVIAWAPEESVEFTAGEDTYIEDLNGNEIPEKVFALGKSPIYIHNCGDEVFYSTLAKTIKDKFVTLEEKYGKIEALSFLRDENKVRARLENPITLTETIFSAGDSLLSWYTAEKYSVEKLGVILDKLFKISKYVILSVKDGQFKTESTSAVNQTGNYILNSKNGDADASLKLTDKIYTQAKKYNFRVVDFYDGTSGILRGYDILSKRLCKWAEGMSRHEKANGNVKIITHSYPSYLTTFQDRTETVKYTVMNDRKTAVDGYVVVTDENGKEVSQRHNISAESGKRAECEVAVKIPVDKPAGDYTYRISLMENGEESSYLIFPVSVKTLFDVKLNSVTEEFANLNAVEVVIDCLYEGGAEGVVEITPPSGWKFKEESVKIAFDGKGQKTVKFEILEKAKAKFNEYVIGVDVKKENGELITGKKIPLDFNVILKNSEDIAPAQFDGSLNGWENAYPVHIGSPENPELAEEWEKSNIATRAFLKWNEDYLYILVDNYDEYHSNMFKGSGNWNGDNVQISVDTLCDKATAYQSDDYEIGFSYASDGNDIWEYYNGDNVQKMLNPEYMKVVRDNQHNITRYYVRLPLSELTPISPKVNSKIGFNYGINDGDMVERERFIEYTLGTCTKKSPSLYNDFIFVGTDESEYKVDISSFRVEINNDFTK